MTLKSVPFNCYHSKFRFSISCFKTQMNQMNQTCMLDLFSSECQLFSNESVEVAFVIFCDGADILLTVFHLQLRISCWGFNVLNSKIGLFVYWNSTNTMHALGSVLKNKQMEKLSDVPDHILKENSRNIFFRCNAIGIFLQFKLAAVTLYICFQAIHQVLVMPCIIIIATYCMNFSLCDVEAEKHTHVSLPD